MVTITGSEQLLYRDIFYNIVECAFDGSETICSTLVCSESQRCKKESSFRLINITCALYNALPRSTDGSSLFTFSIFVILQKWENITQYDTNSLGNVSHRCPKEDPSWGDSWPHEECCSIVHKNTSKHYYICLLLLNFCYKYDKQNV